MVSFVSWKFVIDGVSNWLMVWLDSLCGVLFVWFGDCVDGFNPDLPSSTSVMSLKIDSLSESSSCVVGCVSSPKSGDI